LSSAATTICCSLQTRNAAVALSGFVQGNNQPVAARIVEHFFEPVERRDRPPRL
jgi:hypothetical protein